MDSLEANTTGRQWTLTCDGLSKSGAHEDERCLTRRQYVRVEVPTGAADRRVWVSKETIWEHLGDELWDWRDLTAHDRAQYCGLCVPGLLEVTEGIGEAAEIIGLEGMSEAYSTLPFEGGLLSQPAQLLEAFGVVRQTRSVIRMREARNRALDISRNVGS